jgi:hypothetical protein
MFAALSPGMGAEPGRKGKSKKVQRFISQFRKNYVMTDSHFLSIEDNPNIGGLILCAIKKDLRVMLVAVFLIGGVSVARSQEKLAIPIAAIDRIDQIKNPVSWFKWGADVRSRHESIINPSLTDADPPGYNYSFERVRIREWNAFNLCKWFEFNIRFNWEGRHYWSPDSKAEWDKSEIVFDNLNGKFMFPKIPVTLTVGRQDIVFGDGWLISDGTPLDGPRTTYFEAVRVTIDMNKNKSSLDLIYIDQSSSPDRRLSPIFSKSRPLMEQNERGTIINFSNKSIEHTQIDPYFIFKHDEAVLSNGDDGDIFTIGSRLDYAFNNNIFSHFDGAYQFGNRKNAAMFPNQDSRLSAFGINSRFTYHYLNQLKSQVWLGYAILSGNKANDTHNHQFDPLWGRWAQYSELFPNELDRPGERSNLQRFNLGYQVEPTNKMLIQANYHVLFAYANRNSGTPGFSNNGKFKGHLFTALLKYQYDRFWSCLLLGEYFIPGNYYETPTGVGSLRTRNDPAAFLRTQIVFNF